MEFKFSKKPAADGDLPPEGPHGQQDKGRQTALLVVLLLLLGVVGYLYFFTSLIRPQEPPPKPAAPPQVVKQPLPPKGEPASPAPADTVKPGTPAPTAKPAQQSAPPAPGSATKPAAAPAAPPAAKPAPAPAATPTAKQTPTAVAPAAPPAQTQKPAVTTKQPQPAPAAAPAKTPPAPAGKEAAAKPAERAPATVKHSGPWTLVVGLYVVESALAEDMANVRKAGLTPVMTMGPKRPATMHRLHYGSYDDKAEAAKAVEMLKRQAGDGFTVPKAGRYEVFAGSYAQPAGAQSEQQRLAASGIKVTIQKTSVPVASRKLTAGTFTDRTAAEAALKKVKAVVSGTPVLE